MVSKLDRVTRSLKDFYRLWEDFEERGVQFISLNERFDTTSAVGRAMLKLILVFAELEREQTGERTASTMNHRSSRGLWNGGRPPVGFDLDPERKGTLVKDKELAPIIVEHLFRKYIEVESAGKVVRHLRQVGIRTPKYESRRGKRRGGGYFTKPAVLRALANPAYIGKTRHGETLVDAQWQGIVPQPLFDEVQALLARNRDIPKRGKPQRQHVYLLQGLIRCGRCGGMMSPKACHGRNGREYFYYVCSRRMRTATTSCDADYVPAEAAENYVMDVLRQWSLSEEEIARVVQEANEGKNEQLTMLRKERDSTRGRLHRVSEKIRPLVNAIEEGGAFSMVQERITELEVDKSNLEGEIERIGVEMHTIRQHALSAQIMAESYRDVPSMINTLFEAERWQELKGMISNYVEVIDWHQDREDPTTGRVDIMLFEQPEPIVHKTRKNEERPSDPVISGGALRRNDWLPG